MPAPRWTRRRAPKSRPPRPDGSKEIGDLDSDGPYPNVVVRAITHVSTFRERRRLTRLICFEHEGVNIKGLSVPVEGVPNLDDLRDAAAVNDKVPVGLLDYVHTFVDDDTVITDNDHAEGVSVGWVGVRAHAVIVDRPSWRRPVVLRA